MDGATTRMLLWLGLAIVVLYLVRLNWIMSHTPTEAAKHADGPLRLDDIREVYDRVKDKGIDWHAYLPTKTERRYIVVGGSGLVGGAVVLDLMAMGIPAQAIRIIDARQPFRQEFSTGGVASDVKIIQTDITSEKETLDAFEVPWPSSVSRLPLTVFHTAAVIRPFERFDSLYYRNSRVNVGGTANVLSAAKKVGTNIFIATSSSSVGQRNVPFFMPPWRRQPRNYVQLLDGKDFFSPLRSSDFPSNYARSKAEAERLVCAADEPAQGGMRTGAIRPGNAVYGDKNDQVIGRLMDLGWSPTHGATFVQHWANAGNAALAHIQYEAAMLGAHVDKVAGRPYIITDSGPPLLFDDLYTVLSTVTSTGFRIYKPPPLLFLMVAYAIETFTLLVRLPVLRRVLSEPSDPVNLLQPATIVSGATSIVDDSEAKKSPAEGGMGYRAACTTVEGLCAQAADWNRWVAEGRPGPKIR